jgi:hypothetical protein
MTKNDRADKFTWKKGDVVPVSKEHVKAVRDREAVRRHREAKKRG